MPDEPAPLAAIDRLVHEPARLMVLASLYVVESADYTFLVRQTGLTWGNLSSHIAKLEAAGYITVEKTFEGRRPRTLLSLTGTGRQAVADYRARMMQVLDGLPDDEPAPAASPAAEARARPDPGPRPA